MSTLLGDLKIFHEILQRQVGFDSSTCSLLCVGVDEKICTQPRLKRVYKSDLRRVWQRNCTSNKMNREEKQMDLFLENSLVKLSDLKKTIGQMIHKIGKPSLLMEIFHRLMTLLPSRIRAWNYQLAGIPRQLRFDIWTCKKKSFYFLTWLFILFPLSLQAYRRLSRSNIHHRLLDTLSSHFKSVLMLMSTWRR